MNVITMPTTTNTQANFNGFAFQLQPDTDLGSAILIVEDEQANYEPVAVAANISEGKEMAQADLRARLGRLERDEDPGICPYQYQLWARGVDGRQHVAASRLAAEL